MQSEQFELHARIEQRHWWFVARRRIMRAIVEEVARPDGRTTVVDVGCGTGANIATLTDGYRCVGIDTSEEAIELATRRFPDVRFVCGIAPDDLRRIRSAFCGLADGAHDHAIAVNSGEHEVTLRAPG